MSVKKIKIQCPGCPCKTSEIVDLHKSIYRCVKCEAIHGRPYLGQSYDYVLPYFAKMSTENIPEDRIRYFDFTCLSSKGLMRRHGWYDPVTKYLVQTG